MNYITHLNGMLEKFSQDTRLNPKHVSLYMALFRRWNGERFPEWFSISRKEIMKDARMGSKSNYHRCLQNLHQWGYVLYKPSHSVSGSRIKIIQVEGVPLGGQPGKASSSVLGHRCPNTEQVSLYNKHINFKKVFEEKKEAFKNAFKKENRASKSIISFFRWLVDTYSEKELVKTNWESLIPIWKKEQQLIAKKNQRAESHFEDNLKTQKFKRYDQPL